MTTSTQRLTDGWSDRCPKCGAIFATKDMEWANDFVWQSVHDAGTVPATGPSRITVTCAKDHLFEVGEHEYSPERGHRFRLAEGS